MRKMDNLHLADFVELQLKSRNDFDPAYDRSKTDKFFKAMCARVNQQHSLHDHSTYSYPSIAGSDKEESLEVNLTSQC